jgi:uncharacterized membrane protein YheB (UPF0754 family)
MKSQSDIEQRCQQLRLYRLQVDQQREQWRQALHHYETVTQEASQLAQTDSESSLDELRQRISQAQQAVNDLDCIQVEWFPHPIPLTIADGCIEGMIAALQWVLATHQP